MPPFESGYLEQTNVGVAYMVKSNLRINPFCVVFCQAGYNVGNNFGAHFEASWNINTLKNQKEKKKYLEMFNYSIS